MKIELQNVNTNKLHDELMKAGIIPSLVESLGTATWVTVDDSQQSAVMAVVAVHNPAPIPQAPSQLELLQKAVDDLIMGGI